MTPKVKKSKILTNAFDGTQIHVSWPNLVKISHWEVSKKSSGISDKKTPAPQESSEPPIFPHFADRAQNFLNVVTSGPAHMYQLWSISADIC